MDVWAALILFSRGSNHCKGHRSSLFHSPFVGIIQRYFMRGNREDSVMAVTIGTELGSHSVTALLGRGGMGEVYRAKDSKLKREVAIKILPEEFARDHDRLSRFQREAEMLASLNHPNIAAIYDIQEARGSLFLVLELVEGDTLANRIARGPIPLEEALPIAKQICEALEAAHEKGVVHRDLKPANIKVSSNGGVKVLDFGLAKAMSGANASPAGRSHQAMDNAPSNAALSNSPTMASMAATNAGVILGTAAYMSPEQARGLGADPRSDVFSFGCVLYEMLTGKQAFPGDTISDILASVLKSEPDLQHLPANLHPQLRSLLRRSLEKSLKRRWQAIGDVRLEIDEVIANPSPVKEEAEAKPAASKRERLVWAFGMLVAVSAIAFLSYRDFNRAEPAEVRLQIVTPPTDDPISLAVSPDGQRIAFVAGDTGKSQLWVRPLNSAAAQPLRGTEGASYPFWSPDSRSLGFFADGKLKRVDIDGGAPQVLANANSGRGGAWNRDGVILFAPTGASDLFRIGAAGGEALAVTHLEPGQTAHKFPEFLPDGHHFIYVVQGNPSSAILGSLDGSPSKRLGNAEAAARITPSGWMLNLRQGTLFTQRFDFAKLELAGNPFSVADQVASDGGVLAAAFSAASNTVAYRTGAAGGSRQLTWVDRTGKVLSTVGDPDHASPTDVELAPDGKRVVVLRTVDGNTDIWLLDMARGVPTRLTFDPSSDQRPSWTPDGARIAFNSSRKGSFNLYQKAANGAGSDELLLESDQNKSPADWSPDGRFLLFRSLDPKTGQDLWALPTFGDKKPFVFLKTPFNERDGQFSPDGRWVTYQSDESGRSEIYAQPFPGPGGKFQISAGGGAQPRWNRNGKEVFYVSLDSKMMAAPVKASADGQSLESGAPVELFPVRVAGGPLPGPPRQQYAVSPDGQRFLITMPAGETEASPINLILNWKPK